MARRGRTQLPRRRPEPPDHSYQPASRRPVFGLRDAAYSFGSCCDLGWLTRHRPNCQYQSPHRVIELNATAVSLDAFNELLRSMCYTFCSNGGALRQKSTAMSRPRYRACLEDGLRLDLNKLARKGFIKVGASIGARGIAWRNSDQGEIASGVITADMADPCRAWFQITIGSFVQRIALVPRARHFGGRLVRSARHGRSFRRATGC